MFLLAGLWALVVPGVWLRPAALADPVFWHWHELVFGMAGAAAGGYLLTALPNWTGHRTGRAATAGLVLAWLFGRGALLLAAPGDGLGMAAALAYPLTLAALLLGPVLAARVWRRLPVAALPLALAGAEAATLRAQAAGSAAPLLPVLGFALVIGAIGGRAVPAFSRSRLGSAAAGLDEGRIAGRAATAAVAVAALLLGSGGPAFLAGAALVVAGAVQAARLLRWRSLALRRHGDVMMLHLAWLWLAIGLAVTGFALLLPHRLDPATGLHALTMGAMGTMVFALAARPFMARAPGRLIAGPALGWAFAALCGATVLRLCLPDATLWGLAGHQWSALAWGAGWAVFLGCGLRSLASPLPFPVLSARRDGV